MNPGISSMVNSPEYWFQRQLSQWWFPCLFFFHLSRGQKTAWYCQKTQLFPPTCFFFPSLYQFLLQCRFLKTDMLEEVGYWACCWFLIQRYYMWRQRQDILSPWWSICWWIISSCWHFPVLILQTSSIFWVSILAYFWKIIRRCFATTIRSLFDEKSLNQLCIRISVVVIL